MSRCWLFAGALLLFVTGCGEAMPTTAPAKGVVTYRGQPLKFGSVMFQPVSGQAARAEIQPDGSFDLVTERYGDGPAVPGAAIGTHLVRITCYEGQSPNAGGTGGGDRERPLGKSLIPEHYTNVETSGIKLEVKPGGEPFKIELVDPK